MAQLPVAAAVLLLPEDEVRRQRSHIKLQPGLSVSVTEQPLVRGDTVTIGIVDVGRGPEEHVTVGSGQ